MGVRCTLASPLASCQFCAMKAVLFLAIATTTLFAEAPRVLPVGTLPDDVRLGALKELDGYFPWSPPATAAAWAERAEKLRMQMRVALGVWPAPTRTPLNAVIHGRTEREDYSVEKVYFEAMPGFFVSGNLYRPKLGGKHPGVLCPHGHWPGGRFMDEGVEAVEKKIATGAEALVESGRSLLQSRCVLLTRMGCVVLQYDMIGYADSVQISLERAHQFAKQSGNEGLYSPLAESRAQSVLGLQQWSSVRALDFLESLPDVDATRLACTGASGGGTQTFLLAALDARLAAAFPAVMVGTGMQGGCTCENASLLRVGTGNVEFAALFAPKPMGMTCADDWTKEMPEKGYPQLQQHWASLGAAENVRLFAHTEFPHNYNLPSRLAMAGWFNTHLHLGQSVVEERAYTRLTREEMSVWDAAHPAPEGGGDFERKLLSWWSDDAAAQLGATFEKIARPAVEAIFQRTLAGEKATLVRETLQKEDRGDWMLLRGVIANSARHEALPAFFFHPKHWNGRTVVWLTEQGKAGLLESAEVQRCLRAGDSVIGVDLMMQGEFTTASDTPTRRSKNPREVAAYTFGYNASLFTQRVQDVLSVLAFVRDQPEHHSQKIALVALDATAPIAAAARALAGNAIHATALDTRGFRFAAVDDLRSPWFQPAIAKYGDLPALLRLGSGALWVKGEGTAPEKTASDWLAEQ